MLHTNVDDELYEELAKLVGEKVVHVEVWEESLSDSLEGRTIVSDKRESCDIDLYLEGGVYFELYGVTCFTDLDEDPWVGHDVMDRRLHTLVKNNVRLEEVAVDEEDGLVLVLGQLGAPVAYLAVSAWLLEEWDELPE
jgi:hypothetical protein